MSEFCEDEKVERADADTEDREEGGGKTCADGLVESVSWVGVRQDAAHLSRGPSNNNEDCTGESDWHLRQVVKPSECQPER
jgi:hypothetical protein